MDLDQRRTFLTAADTLNFTQAARHLYIPQPAVSQQIREPENGLKVALYRQRFIDTADSWHTPERLLVC